MDEVLIDFLAGKLTLFEAIEALEGEMEEAREEAFEEGYFRGKRDAKH